MCRDFDMFEVKVPIVFFGTQGFSAHRDGRYIINSIYTSSTLTITLLICHIINYYDDINLINNSGLIKYPFY